MNAKLRGKMMELPPPPTRDPLRARAVCLCVIGGLSGESGRAQDTFSSRTCHPGRGGLAAGPAVSIDDTAGLQRLQSTATPTPARAPLPTQAQMKVSPLVWCFLISWLRGSRRLGSSVCGAVLINKKKEEEGDGGVLWPPAWSN